MLPHPPLFVPCLGKLCLDLSAVPLNKVPAVALLGLLRLWVVVLAQHKLLESLGTTLGWWWTTSAKQWYKGCNQSRCLADWAKHTDPKKILYLLASLKGKGSS
jgi:hypothetical protein